MSATPIIAVEWDGEILRPLRRFDRTCNETFVVGEVYHVEIVDEVQSARDKAYHIEMKEAWRQLPDDIGKQFLNADDFRHWCLIECGFCTVKRLFFASPEAAWDARNEFRGDGAQVAIIDAAVVVKRPLSQKLGRRGDMDKETRLRSYRETADLAASLIGVAPEQLACEAGRAA